MNRQANQVDAASSPAEKFDRKRIGAALIMIAAIGLVGTYAKGWVPRALDVRIESGEPIDELQIDVLEGTEPVSGLRLHPNPPVSSIQQTLKLSPGQYDVVVSIAYRDRRASTATKAVVVPTDAPIAFQFESNVR